MKKLLLVQEVANLLRCTPKTVYRLIDEGRLVALNVRIGGIRIVADSVEKHIERQISKFQIENGPCE